MALLTLCPLLFVLDQSMDRVSSSSDVCSQIGRFRPFPGHLFGVKRRRMSEMMIPGNITNYHLFVRFKLVAGDRLMC